MKFSNKILILSLFAFSILTSCNDDDICTNCGEEVITTVNYTLTSTSGEVVVLSFVDADGPNGGNAPVITGGTLSANTTYIGNIEFLNEIESPTEDITEEIQAEDLDHQVFFVPNSSLNATITYTDQDSQGNPLGIGSMLVTGDASTGELKIILRHEPVKTASGVADGDPSNAGGETDIEVSLPVTIQ